MIALFELAVDSPGLRDGKPYQVGDLAVRAIVFGAVGTAGQRCTSTRRLIVHESLCQTMVEHLMAAYRQIRIGLPLDPEVEMGPLISGEAVAAFSRGLREAEEAGGEILYGGQVIEGPGYYVQSTLVRAQNHWPVVQRETFAPILYLMTFKDIESAIAINNDARQGLSSALFYQLPLPRRALSRCRWIGLRDRQCQCRYLWRGDRWRLRRRERHGRGTRGRIRCLEMLYAPSNQYDQLGNRASPGPRDPLRQRGPGACQPPLESDLRTRNVTH